MLLRAAIKGGYWEVEVASVAVSGGFGTVVDTSAAGTIEGAWAGSRMGVGVELAGGVLARGLEARDEVLPDQAGRAGDDDFPPAPGRHPRARIGDAHGLTAVTRNCLPSRRQARGVLR